MTTKEFNDAWDVLVSQYYPLLPNGIINPLQLDDYEKSIFLTEAQEEVLKSLYRGGTFGDGGYEQNEELRGYLNNLTLSGKGTLVSTVDLNDKKVSTNSVFMELEPDVWFIVYESATLRSSENNCISNNNVQVIPIRHDEYNRLKGNPFRGANGRRVLRLDVNPLYSSNRIVELVSKYIVYEYNYRYIKKPNPIILTTFEDGLSINGSNTEATSELPESLHMLILRTAVQKAVQSKQLFNSKAS